LSDGHAKPPAAPDFLGPAPIGRRKRLPHRIPRSGTDWAAIEASGDLSIERGFEIVLE
jgi:hypothetical protein